MLVNEHEMLGIEKQYPEIEDAHFFDAARKVHKHTISDIAAMWALWRGVEYITRAGIPGDIVECGVWNGGSILLAAYALQHFGDTSRKLYLYDTFEGMPKPGEVDVDNDGNSALNAWENMRAQGRIWGFGGTQEMVEDVVYRSGYPREQFVFVKGMVEDTLESTIPKQISILRLDTDLYQSTYHEMVVGYPKLVDGGILIVDDYGYFKGSRLATDQYFEEQKLPIFLTRVNKTVHMAIKR